MQVILNKKIKTKNYMNYLSQVLSTFKSVINIINFRQSYSQNIQFLIHFLETLETI